MDVAKSRCKCPKCPGSYRHVSGTTVDFVPSESHLWLKFFCVAFNLVNKGSYLAMAKFTKFLNLHGGEAEWLWRNMSNLVGSTRSGTIPVAYTANDKPTANSAVHPSEVGR